MTLNVFKWFQDPDVFRHYFYAIIVSFFLTMITTTVIAHWIETSEKSRSMNPHYVRVHWTMIFWGGVFGQLLQIGMILLILMAV